MGQRASALGAEAFEVRRCEPMSEFMYLAPGASRLTSCTVSAEPPRAAPAEGRGVIRVVCISDTHNEHESLRLPRGDLLIHAGDCLTETGQRGYVRRTGGVIQEVKQEGIALFEYFADWFGALDFPYKVLIGGNHDLVMQGLGKERVQHMLDRSATRGKCIYLEHEEVCVGGIRIFGSPFGFWGGKNDAFLSQSCDYTDLPAAVHIMVTHSPAILPSHGGGFDEDFHMTSALHRTGALLHVSGHCHWAHGLYHAKGTAGSVPCVVASVCEGSMYGGPWRNSQPERLASAQGIRADPLDRKFGGYNLVQPPIVCDLLPPRDIVEDAVPLGTPLTRSISSAPTPEEESTGKPGLLFFGPPNDPDFVRSLLPRVRKHFDVDFVDDTADGIRAVAARTYMAMVSKLGTEGNPGYPIIDALRKSQGDTPFIAIHSWTAANNPKMRDQLVQQFKVNLFVAHGREDELVAALQNLVTPP